VTNSCLSRKQAVICIYMCNISIDSFRSAMYSRTITEFILMNILNLLHKSSLIAELLIKKTIQNFFPLVLFLLISFSFVFHFHFNFLISEVCFSTNSTFKITILFYKYQQYIRSQLLGHQHFLHI
jgi:hypothetical protein